jgi:hypothetical protein
MSPRLDRRRRAGRYHLGTVAKKNCSLGLILVIALAACATAPTTPPLAVSTPEATAVTPTPAATAGTPTPSTNAVRLTGFGATDSEWEQAHTADPRFAAGAAYDPTPGLGPDPGHNDAYYAVQHTNGRVLGYSERVAPRSAIAAAKRAAMAEFPADVAVLWFATLDTCAQEELQSAILGQALAEPAIGDAAGRVLVEFVTETKAGDAGYSPTNANELLFMLGDYASAADSAGC